IAFGSWVVSWSNHVKKELVVHVYFCTNDTCAKEATATQMNRIARATTARTDLVKRVDFVSKQDALAQLKQKHPDEDSQLPTNPFPNALTVVPKQGDDVDKVAALFQSTPGNGIEKVDYGTKTTHEVLRPPHVNEAFLLIRVL